MNMTFLIIVTVLLLVLIMVVAYNMHQENQYRKNIRRQFGHADQDALMETQTVSVRDGQRFGEQRYRASIVEKVEVNTLDDSSSLHQPTHASDGVAMNENEENKEKQDKEENSQTILFEEQPSENQMEAVVEPVFELTAPEIKKSTKEKIGTATKKLLMGVEELARTELSWFDKRFDFMAYVALPEPKELQAIPRFSLHQKFQIVGCTMNGRFKLAEPIPNVHYQAFVIGLQGISRRGLVGAEELKYFGIQVQQFANKIGGVAFVSDAVSFIEKAVIFDELCAKVDQTIAIHLVSHTSIPGVALRHALENCGFHLMLDGTFAYQTEENNILYSIVALDGSEFTDSLLLGQPYKGFSMLFDITRVPAGEKNFNEFMNFAVKLSSELSLDLVDDQIQPLSTEWLKEVRSYVGVLQHEMLEVGIEPGGVLAKRLFS